MDVMLGTLGCYIPFGDESYVSLRYSDPALRSVLPGSSSTLDVGCGSVEVVVDIDVVSDRSIAHVPS